MKKKKLFQRVMGLTITVVLAGSTCISPALAEELFLDGTEAEELFLPETESEPQTATEEGELFTDGTGEDLFTETLEETTQEAIRITTQPQNVVTEKGATVEFSVGAEGEGLSYQWQYRTSKTGKWKNFASATAATIRKVTGNWNGWQVKCVIKDAAGNSLDSDIVSISIGNNQEQPISITTQPEDVVTKKGETVEFSVKATGNNLSYQWQYRTSEKGSWKNFASATKATIQKITGNWDGWQVKCVIKDANGNSVETKSVKIAFENASQEELAITEQPEDVVTAKGEKVQWKIAATGKNITYQWQYRISESGQWKNFASAKMASIEKVVGNWDGWQVKCVVKDSAGNSLDSDIAKITFDDKEELAITAQPEDVEAEKDMAVKFSVKAMGNGLSYQWQYRTSEKGSWKNFASATKATIQKVTGDWNGWQVRCVIKDKDNNSIITRIANIKFIEKKLEITEQPKDVKVQLGKTADFSVTVNKDKVSYQWETRGAYQSEFTPVEKATESVLHVDANEKNNGQVYRCVITDVDGTSVTSDEAVLRIEYQNHTATFVNAETKEVIVTAEAETFEAKAGLPAGTIIRLPKAVTEKTAEPYSYYTVENETQIPLNLEAVVEGSSASYDTLELFFYVDSDVVVYVTA